jgi:hypothetical protein
MKPREDRRATPRFVAKKGNHIIYGTTPAAIQDLSLEGVYVHDPDPLPVGSELAFTMMAGDTEITLDGVVRRVVEQEGMGIQFMNVSAISKRRLRIHIASLAPAPSQLEKA